MATERGDGWGATTRMADDTAPARRPLVERERGFDRLPMRVAEATFMPPSDERLRFIKQLGVDDLIVWGNTFRAAAGGPDELTFKELLALRGRVEDAGLRLVAIENVPLPFYDRVILGADGRDAQIAHFQATIRHVGRAGIPILGYNWILSGVWRTSFTVRLRGDARGTGFDARAVANAPFSHGRDHDEEAFWGNYAYFLERVLPVAEEEGVKLAIHPNDPPVPKIGGVPFLFRSMETFRRALDLVPSPNHGVTFCLGNWSEMGVDIVESIRAFGARHELFYVHFQAVTGSVPAFHETFVDEADYDPYELLRVFREVGFNGVMIPGHVPQVEGDTEWRTPESLAATPYNHPMGGHRGRAYTIGYLRGMLRALAHPANNPA